MVKALLIAEDAEARALAERAFAKAVMSVASAPDYRSGYEMLRAERPGAVVIGISVPDLHGYDLCQEIRRDPAFQDVPIVICSAQSYPADIRRAKALGADEYVVKPYAERQLVDAVCNAIELRSAVFRVTLWG